MNLTTPEERQTRDERGWWPDYRSWDRLRSRLPMTLEEAHGILEADSECRAEYGCGYVCGGGSPGDAMLAYSWTLSDRTLDLLGEARRVVEERWKLHIDAPTLNRLDHGAYVLAADDDIPF